MTECGQHKLADNGTTTPELKQLCERILRDYGVPLMAVELVSILKSDYGKDVPTRRLANILLDDNHISRAKKHHLPKHLIRILKDIPSDECEGKWWYWFP
jgi:hypothetical protein